MPYKIISSSKWSGFKKYSEHLPFLLLVFRKIMFIKLLLSSMYISKVGANEYFAVKL